MLAESFLGILGNVVRIRVYLLAFWQLYETELSSFTEEAMAECSSSQGKGRCVSALAWKLLNAMASAVSIRHLILLYLW
jgi:hypothetical protein